MTKLKQMIHSTMISLSKPLINIYSNDNNDLYFASAISNSSSLKLNDYVQREKEGLNQVQKVKPSFNKKKLFELANSMDYLSHCSENYFPQSIARKKREQKKMEKENMSKDS